MERQELINILTECGVIKDNAGKTPPFCDYLKTWLTHHRKNIRESTYNAYCTTLVRHLIPYFSPMQLHLGEVSADILNDYFTYKSRNGLKNNTLKKHYALLSHVFKTALRNELIVSNPVSQMNPLKGEKFISECYDINELNDCFKLFSNDPIYLAVLCAGALGLRRSEVLGLTWNALDFNKRTIIIRKTVVKSYDPNTGKQIDLMEDKTKSQTSYRTLVLPDFLFAAFAEAKQEQAKWLLTNPNFNSSNKEFVLTDKKWRIIKPKLYYNSLQACVKEKRI